MSSRIRGQPPKAPLDNSIDSAIRTYREMAGNSSLVIRKGQLKMVLSLLAMATSIEQYRRRAKSEWAAIFVFLISYRPLTRKIVTTQEHRIGATIIYQITSKAERNLLNRALEHIQYQALKRDPGSLPSPHHRDLVTFATQNGHSIVESTQMAVEPSVQAQLIVRIVERVNRRNLIAFFSRLRKQRYSDGSHHSSKEVIAIKFAATNILFNRLQLKVMNVYSQLMVTIQLISQSRNFFERQELLLTDQTLNQKIQHKLQSMNTMCFVIENVFRNDFYAIGESTGFLQKFNDIPDMHHRGAEIIVRILQPKLVESFAALKSTDVLTESLVIQDGQEGQLYLPEGQLYLPEVEQPVNPKELIIGEEYFEPSCFAADARYRDYSFQKNTFIVTETPTMSHQSSVSLLTPNEKKSSILLNQVQNYMKFNQKKAKSSQKQLMKLPTQRFTKKIEPVVEDEKSEVDIVTTSRMEQVLHSPQFMLAILLAWILFVYRIF